MKKTENFVLDTNTLISAFLLSSASVAAQAYYKAKSKGKIVLSEETFNEFSDVFVRSKFDRYIALPKRLIIIDELKKTTPFVKIDQKITVCRDPKDDKYLELAVFSNASFIITGDKDLLVLNPFKNIQIVTSAGFLEI